MKLKMMDASNNKGLTGKGQLFVSISLGVLVLVVVVLVVLIAIALHRTVRLWLSTHPPHLPNSFVALAAAAAADQDSISIEVGLDAATLGGFPSLLYSEAKTLDDINGGSSSTTCCCCSICLADYKESDVLRLLPDCGHVFHVKCIDPWLRLRPTCPNCRNSPLPTPLATPSAEVTPFARQPD